MSRFLQVDKTLTHPPQYPPGGALLGVGPTGHVDGLAHRHRDADGDGRRGHHGQEEIERGDHIRRISKSLLRGDTGNLPLSTFAHVFRDPAKQHLSLVAPLGLIDFFAISLFALFCD